jgi:hypothetical protein
LSAERSERLQSDAALQAQMRQNEEQARTNAARLEELQRAHDQLAATAMINRYTHPSYSLARGGGPPMFDSSGFYRRPRIELSTGGGAAGYDNSRGFVTMQTGGTWTAHAGIAFANWLALEARYTGTVNSFTSPAVVNKLVLNGGDLVARFTAPFPLFQPYGYAGLGIYNQSVTGTITDQTVAALNGRDMVTVPVGGGLNIPLVPWMSLAFEGGYAFFLNSFGTNLQINQRGLWNATGLLRFSL